MVTISGTKVWDDNNNQDGLRDEITVILNKTVDGLTSKVKEIKVTGNEENNWNFEFTDLPKYESGKEIIYSLEELDLTGYTSEIEDFTITNTHTPETITFNIQKNWDDQENNDGIRPDEITVRLKADGVEIASAVLSSETSWKASFEDLPKYHNQGTLIKYEIVEDEVLGYEINIEDAIIDNDGNQTIVITNTHEIETTDITIEKIWDDEENESKRPESITVNVYANSELYEIVEITKENNWTYNLTGLQKYLNGEEIVYTIEEIELEDYITTYSGYTIINSYKSKGEITPPNTGINRNTNTNSNTYYELILLLLGTLSITYTYTFKKIEN